jgi:hypothetical protein
LMGGRRRRGLADLIDEIGAAPQESESEGRDRKSTATGARKEVPGSGGGATVEPPAREQSRDEAMTPAPRVPKYLALERKEARLRGDQVDSLASLARRVNRRKASRGGERITENTLIRVAVDWLLSQEQYVGGSTEEEIRRGLGVAEPRIGRHNAP